MMPVKKHPRLLVLWLSLCAALVVCMVAVGGYTRLSGSGLSITEWKPIHGVVPPLDETEWQEEFSKYQQIPQYAAVNQGMTLEEFKHIFWPEYWHRVLGRAIGIVFLVPLLFFWAGGFITHRFGLRLTAIFALGGLQGLMGWYMVSSGLINNIYVSHLRLSAHLALALLLLGLLVWEIMIIKPSPLEGEGWVGGGKDCAPTATTPHLDPPPQGGRKFIIWFTLLAVQIFYGALMAGTHCGLIYNTYPTMNGAWIPSGLWDPALGWDNLFGNCTAVQFIHRNLAILVALGFALWWSLYRKSAPKVALGIGMVIIIQFTLGVATLLHAVPLWLGLTHQLMAVLLFVLAVILLYRLSHD